MSLRLLPSPHSCVISALGKKEAEKPKVGCLRRGRRGRGGGAERRRRMGGKRIAAPRAALLSCLSYKHRARDRKLASLQLVATGRAYWRSHRRRQPSSGSTLRLLPQQLRRELEPPLLRRKLVLEGLPTAHLALNLILQGWTGGKRRRRCAAALSCVCLLPSCKRPPDVPAGRRSPRPAQPMPTAPAWH